MENKARRLIQLVVYNNYPREVDYSLLDKGFVTRMPDMIFGEENKLIPLLQKMVKEGVLQCTNGGYTKGPNFPESF